MENNEWRKVDIEIMLRNAHRMLRRKYTVVPLWSFVSDITSKGSTSSAMLCTELGWNPNAIASHALPSFAVRAKVETPESDSAD